MSEQQPPGGWGELVNSGLAFLAAILGWVWHAGRLATKIDSMDKKLDKHVEDEAGVWTENRRVHETIMERVARLREDVARCLPRKHPHESDDDE